MSVTCYDILTLPSMKQFTLLGGESGLKRVVSWPYICEDNCISQWVKGGEIAFVTGMGANWSEDKLVDFIRDVAKMNLAAVVFSINEAYIANVPQIVIDEANSLHLPIFEIPWEVKRLEVSKEICTYILNSQNKNNFANLLFEILMKDAITLEEESEMHLLLSEAGFDESVSFYGVNIYIDECENDGNIMKPLSLIRNTIRGKIDSIYISGKMTSKSYHNHMKLLLNTKESRDIVKKKLRVLCEENDPVRTGYRVYVGIGRPVDRISQVKASFSEAERCVSIISNRKDFGPLAFYDELGLYRILLGREVSSEEIHSYSSMVIGEIEKHDETFDAVLLKTIVAYFENSFNATKTAEALFIHRNSLMYRFEKIESISGKSMKNPYDVLEFVVCCMIKGI